MSRKKNNRDDHFNEFLKGREQDTGQDDFEKEALEGFAMLGSEDEKIKAKKELDRRIEREVFSEAKDTSGLKFWFAAAGIMLVVGLSVYFLLSQQAEREDLAISQSPKRDDFAKKNAAFEQAPAGKNDEPTISNRTKSYVKAEKDEKSAEVNRSSYDSIMDVTRSVSKAEKEITIQISSGALASQQMNASGNARHAEEPEAKEANQAPEMEDLSAADFGSNSSSQQAKVASPATSKESIKKKSAFADNSSFGMVAGNTCSYSGGEKALQKDLQMKLREKDLLYPFDARLFVNGSRKVDSVEIIKSFEMSNEQKRRIIETLETLEKFKTQGVETPGVYLVTFRP